MTDHFALLNEPRRPWLDPEALKQKFLTLSAEVHPDRVHNLGATERAAAQERYTQLNGAYNCLRDPKERLRHLLQLERGALPQEVQQIPSDLMDLSLAIGQACRKADALAADKAQVSSPLLKVQFFARAQDETETLAALQQKVQATRDRLSAELQRLDAEWTTRVERATLLPSLEGLYRLLRYFDRWNEQLQERIAQLSF